MSTPQNPQQPVSSQQPPAEVEARESRARSEFRPVRLRTVKGSGGVELCVAEAGNLEGRPVLLVHGFCQSHESWEAQLHSALGLDFRLVAMDLRGHGRSEKPENVYADSRVWAEDLHAVITTLGLKRPVLVGWSYGGIVLADYLRHYGQENVAGVQFVGALTRLGKPEFFADFGAEFLQLLPTLLSPDADQGRKALEAFADMLTQQPLAPPQRAAVLRYSSVVPLHVRLAIGQRRVDGADVLSALTVPVLATHGAVDRVVLPETSRRIASLAPNAELSLYPDVGHSPFAEDARRFNEELARFVARCG